MGNNTVRLVKMEMDYIKNVIHGNLKFATPNSTSNIGNGSILGIYGQNGSGKSAVIDCLILLKHLLSGKSIPAYFFHYINQGSDYARVKYCFHIKTDVAEIHAEYIVRLKKTGPNNFRINGEKLNMKILDQENGKRLIPLFDYRNGEKELFRPSRNCRYFKSDREQIAALNLARESTDYYNEERKEPEIGSFLFSEKAQEVFEKAKGETGQISFLSRILQGFVINNLAIMDDLPYGLVSLNLKDLAATMDCPAPLKLKPSGVVLQLADVNIIPRDIYPHLVSTIGQINMVIKSFMSDVELEICNLVDKLTQDGREGVQFEIRMIRGEYRIPLLYESPSIKKIISLCSNLITCYNQESYCLVVDELDSGIYEYLLGEFLKVMQKSAKGQLIFTSNNLRAMEVLDKGCSAYTTTNPENRYVKPSYIKHAQNTRLCYMRSIKQGGQKEKVCNEMIMGEIELAMSRAVAMGVHD